MAQIDLLDRNGLLHVRIANNGVGPLIVERLIFSKDGHPYFRIEDCLAINPTSYDHIDISAKNVKVINPGGHIEIFAKQLDPVKEQTELRVFRQQLAALTFTVEGRDIYDNKVTAGISFAWFARHEQSLKDTFEHNAPKL